MATKYNLIRDVSGAVTQDVLPSDTVVHVNVRNLQENFDIPADKSSYVVIFKYVSNTSDADANKILVEARNYPYPPQAEARKESPLAFSVPGGARIYLSPARIGIDTDVLVEASIYESAETSAPFFVQAQVALQSIYIEATGSTKGVIDDSLFFKAWGIFSDGTTQDLTSVCNWTSVDNYVAQFGSPGDCILLHEGQTDVQAEHIVTGFRSNFITITSVSVSYINVLPQNPTTGVGGTTTFTAVAYFSDGSSSSITPNSWESSSPAVATISNLGVSTGISFGTTNIYCTYRDVPSNISVLTISQLTSIRLVPESVELGIGETRYFTAIGYYSNGGSSTIVPDAWESTYPNIASVDSSGVVTGVDHGSCSVHCNLGAVYSAPASVIVADIDHIEILPAYIEFKLGDTYRLTAFAYYTNGNGAVITPDSWVSLDENIVTVDSEGLITAIAGGSTVISCSFHSITSSPCYVSVKVVTLLTLEPTNPIATVGDQIQFICTATFADGSRDIIQPDTWTSTRPHRAPVDAFGVVTCIALTTDAEITATVDNGMGNYVTSDPQIVTISQSNEISSIDITPQNVVMTAGSYVQFTAIANYIDGRREEIIPSSWSVSDESIATIDANGYARGVTLGVITVTANIVSTARMRSVPSSGEILPMDVSNTTGLVVGWDYISAIEITPSDTTYVIVNVPIQYSCIATFTDGSRWPVTPTIWVPTVDGIISVDDKGCVTGVAVGSTNMYAAIEQPDGPTITSNPIKVNVVEISPQARAISILKITPNNAVMQCGQQVQFIVNATYNDGTNANIIPDSWNVAEPTLFSIDANGLATGLYQDVTTMTATVGAVTSAPVNVRVGYNVSQMTSLDIFPSDPYLVARPSGANSYVQLMAQATYIDTTTGYIKPNRWEVLVSTGPNCTINQDGYATISGAQGGQVEIQAYIDQADGTNIASSIATINLIPFESVVSTLELFPTESTIFTGQTVQLMVRATYNSGLYHEFIYPQFDISDSSVANFVGSYNTLKGYKNGSVTIRAKVGPFGPGYVYSNYITVAVNTMPSVIPVGSTTLSEATSLPGYLPCTGYTFSVTNPLYANLFAYYKSVNPDNTNIPLYGYGESTSAALSGSFWNGVDVFTTIDGTPSGTTKFSLLDPLKFYVTDISTLGCIVHVDDATDIIANPKGYLRLYTVTKDWYISFSINGVIQLSTDIPTGADNIGIVYITTGMTMEQVRQAFVNALNPLAACTSNPSGYGLRVTDNGAGIDPDAATRKWYDGSVGGDHPGTFQMYDTKSHVHNISTFTDGSAVDYTEPYTAGGSIRMLSKNINGRITTETTTSAVISATTPNSGAYPTTGGNETRGSNFALNLFVKY